MRTFIDKYKGDNTYKVIANLAGVTQQCLYTWTMGHKPNIMSFILICRALSAVSDMSYEELVMDGLKHIEEGLD